MHLPQGYAEYAGLPADTSKVLRLHKGQYGLKQSNRGWNQVFTRFMKEYGFKASEADPCLFVKQDPSNSSFLAIAVYVDDIIVVSSSDSKGLEAMQHFKNKVSQRFKMTDLGALTWFLGMEIKQHKDFSIDLNQTRYIEDCAAKYGVTNLPECLSRR